MGGGNQRMIINFRERAISDDHNRLQRFLAKDRNDLMFWMANSLPANAFDAAGACDRNLSIPVAIDTPLRADIYRGLTVLPVAGTTSLHIAPGAIGMWDKDGLTGSSDPSPASADDSDYKVVIADGINTNGVLVMAANPGPGIRIDVIECQRTEVVIETDNRDIFNPATGLFTPTSVNKVTRGDLTYRVRQGTAGNGYPGNAQGWCPLAVASVPAGSTDTDDITFWDVRPLVSERWNAPYRNTFLFPLPYRQYQVACNRFTVPGESRVAGRMLSTQAIGYYAGGTLYKGTPSVPFGGGDLAYIDAENAENQEPGFPGFASGALAFLWVLFPHDLPRWVRYSENPISGIRRPFGMRGIATVSAKGPVFIGDVGPSSPITPPASTGMTGTSATSGAVMVACAPGTSSAAFGSFVTDGDWVILEFDTGLTRTPLTTSLAQDTYSLVANTHYPYNADGLRFGVGCSLTGTGVVRYKTSIDVTDSAGNILGHNLGGEWKTAAFDGATPLVLSQVFKIPIATAGTVYIDVNWTFTTVAGTITLKANEGATIQGWKFGG